MLQTDNVAVHMSFTTFDTTERSGEIKLQTQQQRLLPGRLN